ncbi:mitochondrial carrier domain-containing protein [Lasiosphaeria miniovina]|uniref:Mitochondrial carrier domain-containing protein n=1 Tax=Lasiosphaeria miniovina TaxID=1954250 RepID=A0AA40ADE9_9PEZI|nr:mitochondrial carrier domain-containing protein [Lasiosphaeria miniovina]KAK0713724.1 mitochondrial carrier domain-containing protein [Lasiosphaeria miniovina]
MELVGGERWNPQLQNLQNLQQSSLYPYAPVGIGILPAVPDASQLPEKAPSSNAATGASAAGVRALTSQAVAFYFRAPVKAFFRTRVDYLAYARAVQEMALNQRALSQLHPLPAAASGSSISGAWLWFKLRMHATTPGVLASAVRHDGWRVVPDHVLPPLLANVGVGAVLYTSYLQILGRLHPESSFASRRVYPPPAPLETFAAGFLAGTIQSVVAAPLDAVQARYDLGAHAAGMTGSGNPVPSTGPATAAALERPKNMWSFGAAKLREIGLRGIFAGWGLSFLKDSMGSAVFFATFEYLKAQGYYSFVTWYYGALNPDAVVVLSRKRPAPATRADGLGSSRDDVAAAAASHMPTVIRPHYAIEPTFLLLAGTGASVSQQVVLHPLSHIQVEHWERLEALDAQVRKMRRDDRMASSSSSSSKPAGATSTTPSKQPRWRMFQAYCDAYRQSWAKCHAEACDAGLTMRRWLYRGFWWNTIRQVPSTSAGLIIFELVRRKYGLGADQVRISKDGYDILLN